MTNNTFDVFASSLHFSRKEIRSLSILFLSLHRLTSHILEHFMNSFFVPSSWFGCFEFFLTMSTLMNLLTVWLSMFTQIFCRWIVIATYFACIWTLGRMKWIDVFLQSSRRDKSSIALFALMWHLFTMRSHIVYFPARRIGKWFSTNSTEKWTFTRMHSHVNDLWPKEKLTVKIQNEIFTIFLHLPVRDYAWMLHHNSYIWTVWLQCVRFAYVFPYYMAESNTLDMVFVFCS